MKQAMAAERKKTVVTQQRARRLAAAKLMRPTALLLLSAAALVSACGTLSLSPIANDPRTVQVASDPKKTVSVPEGMIWYDSPAPTRGLRFPPGRYTIEAEDADYWYFRSAAPLEFRSFQNGKVTEERSTPGGLMLGKNAMSMVPGGGYIDGMGSEKVMIWKLGRDFLRREGREWKKNF